MTDQIGTPGGHAQRAPWYVSLFNPITRRLLAAGVWLGPNGLLTVRGRRSGEPRTTPLAVIRAGGQKWIWSPWGEVNWVRNLRAAGRAIVTLRGRPEEVEAVELDPSERLAFFRGVMVPLAQRVPLGYVLFRVMDGVDMHHPDQVAASHPVFELRSPG